MERKVLSIVAEIEKRRLAKAREVAERAHRREPLAAVEAVEAMQQLDEMDVDAALGELESADDPEAVDAAAGLRCMRALRACARGEVEAGFAEWEAVIAAHPTLSIPYVIRGRWWLQGADDTPNPAARFLRQAAYSAAGRRSGCRATAGTPGRVHGRVVGPATPRRQGASKAWGRRVQTRRPRPAWSHQVDARWSARYPQRAAGSRARRRRRARTN